MTEPRERVLEEQIIDAADRLERVVALFNVLEDQIVTWNVERNPRSALLLAISVLTSTTAELVRVSDEYIQSRRIAPPPNARRS